MKKNQQILVLNTFAIIMVCIGHSFTAVESYYGHKWIYSFHMPLFMFISGYLLNYATMHKQQEISDISLLGKQGYIVKRAIRLLVPYFIISSITYIPIHTFTCYCILWTTLSNSSGFSLLYLLLVSSQ